MNKNINNMYKSVIGSRKNAVEVPWTQPVLTENGMFGSTLNMAVNALCRDIGETIILQGNSLTYSGKECYRAFDNNTGTECQFHYASLNNYPYLDLEMSFPQPVRISEFTITNGAVDKSGAKQTHAPVQGSIMVSNDATTWNLIKDWANASTGAYAQWDISTNDNTSYRRFYRIRITDSWSTIGIARIGEIKITATMLEV